jgi:predicted MFS family arabinose efflux permease
MSASDDDLKNSYSPEGTGFLNGRIVRPVKDYWFHLKLFSRNVRLYLLGSFLLGLTFSAFMLLLNLYLREMYASEAFIGSVLSGNALGMTLAAIPAAIILRRVRLKKILISTTIIYVLAIVMLTHLPVTDFLRLISFVSGFSIAFYRVAASPFFMRNSTPKERTYIFSLSFGTIFLSSMIGSVVFGKLVAILSGYFGDIISAYRWTFVVSAFLGILAMLPFTLIKASDPAKEEIGSAFSFKLLRKQKNLYFKLIFPHFIVGSGAGLIIPFLNLYFRDRFGQPPDKIGLFYTAVHTTMVIGILAGPVLVRKIGMIRAIVFTQLMSMPFMVVLAYTYSLPVAFGAFLVRGTLMNLGIPIGTNFGMEMVSKKEHALVNALLMISWSSSWMISTAIGGRLIEAFGYTLPLMIAVGLYFISSMTYYIFFRNSEGKTTAGYSISEKPDL